MFARHYRNGEIDPCTIVYESFHGSSASCNPRAIFDAARIDPRFSGFKHVWVLDDPTTAPEDLIDESVEIVSRSSPRYPRVLATAGYLVNNSTFPLWYVRRDGQVYVNTWHGVPMKAMFRDERGARTGHANSQRNFLNATHITLPNVFTIDHLLGPAHVRSLCAPSTWDVGSPRLDRTIRSRASWVPDPDRRHILFAPTWRGVLGKPSSQVSAISRIIDVLGTLDGSPITVHVKAHNFHQDSLGSLPDRFGNVTVEVVDPRTDVNDLIARVDVVLTDYSSLLFDALAADVPTVLHIPDIDQYRAERGLYVEPESLPVTVSDSDDSLRSAISRSRRPSDFPPEIAVAARDRYYPHEDGAASERILDLMLGEQTAPPPIEHESKPVIAVFGGGWKRNGISSSALNLLRAIDHTRYDIVLFTDVKKMNSQGWRLVDTLPDHVIQIHRVGHEVRTLRESAAIKRYGRSSVPSAEDEALLRQVAQREGRRIFGDRHVRAAIDFSGYNWLWPWLIAGLPADRHIIFQHNDMASEQGARFESLSTVFASYRHFDIIASVSEETREVNLASLGHLYGSAESVSVRNLINLVDLRNVQTVDLPAVHIDGVPHTILSLETSPEPGVRSMKTTPRFDEQNIHFVTLGRCSPEKNHAMLLDAFAALVERRPEARLTILGEGPLLEQTRARRDELGLSQHVSIPGFATMGLSVLSNADCFVLPSLYEGQPMTILEALALGRPVIVTGIAGSRSALAGGYGHIVEDLSAAAFADAMEQFCRGDLTFKPFDPAMYNQAALEDFYCLIEGPRSTTV